MGHTKSGISVIVTENKVRKNHKIKSYQPTPGRRQLPADKWAISPWWGGRISEVVDSWPLFYVTDMGDFFFVPDVFACSQVGAALPNKGDVPHPPLAPLQTHTFPSKTFSFYRPSHRNYLPWSDDVNTVVHESALLNCWFTNKCRDSFKLVQRHHFKSVVRLTWLKISRTT